MFVCWSVKGGSGTTVVAAALALVLSRSQPSLLVDLAGDAPAALGLPEPAGPGAGDWLASPVADGAALRSLAVRATDTLSVVPRGTAAVDPASARWPLLAGALDGTPAVVVDAGSVVDPQRVAALGGQSVLVVRGCYLALRRAAAATGLVSAVVLVREPGRSLGAFDIERAVGAPVLAEVPFDPGISRAVDSGLLAARLPRTIAHPLRRLAQT